MSRRMTMPEFARRFRMAFPDLGPANHFLDRVLSTATSAPHLDVVALDDALIAKYGSYDEYDISMADFVTARYGPAAATFVREAL